jgi:hypothetical protein
MNTYTADNVVRTFCVVTQVIGGLPVDPSTVTVWLTRPDGVVIDLTSVMVHDSVGNFHADYLPTMLGVYTYQYLGVGAAPICAKQQFLVTDTPF